jgi:AraC family transcriptional activator of pobA
MSQSRELAAPAAIEADVIFLKLDRKLVAALARQVHVPHRHEYQEIIWVRKGTAEHLLDGESVLVPAPSLLVIPEGRIHRFVPAPGLAGCAVRFREAFLPGSSPVLLNQFVGISSIPVPPASAASIDALFALIRTEVGDADPAARATVRHLLRALVAKIEALWRSRATVTSRALTESQQLWERFARLVEQRFRTEHSAAAYAAELGVPLRRLNAVARLFAGATVAEALDRRLMLEARRLLRFSGQSVGEIAFALGFEEHSYFTKVFRRHAGMTPTEYRAAASPPEANAAVPGEKCQRSSVMC